MNTADTRIDIDAQIAQVLEVLPSIGKLLSMTVACYPGAAGRSLAQIKMLTHLHHHGSSTVSELAAACGVSISAASEVVDRLVDDDMITRGANPGDRRQVLLTPTEEARKLGAEIRDLRARQIRVTLDRLGPEHRASVVPVLRALAKTLEEEMSGGRCNTAHHRRPSRTLGASLQDHETE